MAEEPSARHARQCGPRRWFAPRKAPLQASVYANFVVRNFRRGDGRADSGADWDMPSYRDVYLFR